MAITELTDGGKVWARRDRATQLKIWAQYFIGTALFMYGWQTISLETDWDLWSSAS